MKTLLTLCTLVLATLAGPALAQQDVAPAGLSTTGQPADFDFTGQSYVVDGYMGAKWGMNLDQVRTAVAKDFPGAEIGTPVTDPVNRTTILVVAVKSLAPGPTPAAVSYIFGATSKRLMHVNVDWQYAEPTPEQRQALIDAGAAQTRTFIGHYWKLMSVARGVLAGPNSLILFAGEGEAGGLVELRLQGVAYVAQTASGQVASPPPTGQALLHMAFAQGKGQPDVYRIKPGEY